METVEEFFQANKRALQFLYTATDDYIGARCCSLNGLITPTYVLSQQAIEKIIKAYIALLSPNENFKDKKYKPFHDLQPLVNILQGLISIDLKPFKDLCFKLSITYPFLRYPENPHIVDRGINVLSTSVIYEVDELFLFIYENLPIPDKVRSRISLVNIMLDNRKPGIASHKWFVMDNDAYNKRINYFNRSFEWWQLSEEERKNQSKSVTITSINGIEVNR